MISKLDLLNLVLEYNKKCAVGQKRLVLEEHDFFCRCQFCWYKCGGEDRDNKYGKPIPYGKYPTDEMLNNLNHELYEINKKGKNNE